MQDTCCGRRNSTHDKPPREDLNSMHHAYIHAESVRRTQAGLAIPHRHEDGVYLSRWHAGGTVAWPLAVARPALTCCGPASPLERVVTCMLFYHPPPSARPLGNPMVSITTLRQNKTGIFCTQDSMRLGNRTRRSRASPWPSQPPTMVLIDTRMSAKVVGGEPRR
jgi:hypothetical protein